MFATTTPDRAASRSRLLPLEVVIAGVLVLAGVWARLPLDEARLLSFAPMRQFYSALTARAIYFDLLPEGVPAWRAAAVDQYIQTAPRHEPPVIETVAALAYRLLGAESLLIPMALGLACWIGACVLLYRLARRLWGGSALAGLIALTPALFLPYMVTASIMFQPDTPALLLLLLALGWLLDDLDQPSASRLLLAALAAAGALFLRLHIAFFLFAVAALLWLQWRGVRRTLLSPRVYVFAAISLAPAAIYYADALFIGGGARDRLGTTFAPALLSDPAFWAGWWRLIGQAFTDAGFIAAALCAVGALVWARGRVRAVIVGLWVGYAVYGFVFTIHIYTHPYYQTLHLPAVALSLAGGGALLERLRLPHPGGQIAGCALVGGLALWCVGQPNQAVVPYNPDAPRLYRDAGALVGHSLRTIHLTEHWGTPLRYYGEIGGGYWRTRYEIAFVANGFPEWSAAQRLDFISRENGGATHFIITDLAEFARQPDLAALLDACCAMVAQTEAYLIYQLDGG